MAPSGPKIPTARDKQVAAIKTVNPELPEKDGAGILDSFSVHIVAPKDPSYDEEVLTWTLLDLMPRIFSRVSTNSRDLISSFPPSFQKRIGDQPQRVDLQVVVGKGVASNVGARTLYVSNRGWTAYLSTDRPCPFAEDTPNGIGAFFAAALAAGDAFNTAFSSMIDRAEFVQGNYSYDLVTLKTNSPPNYLPRLEGGVLIPDLLLVGVGAVGQAFLVALSTIQDLSGLIRIVDHDLSDEGNEQRCLLAFEERRGEAKVILAEEHLRQYHPLLTVQSPAMVRLIQRRKVKVENTERIEQLNVVISGNYSRYRELTAGLLPDSLVVTALDSDQDRRDVQAALPRTLLNGWTETGHGQLAFGIGRYELSSPFECLACSYLPPPGKPEEADLAASRTGWSIEKCREMLKNPHQKLTKEDIDHVAKWLDEPAEKFQPFVDRSLREFMHGHCGLATLGKGGKPVVASVTHVPALVGAHLATQVVLEVLGQRKASPLTHLAFFDGLRLPTEEQLDAREKKSRCWCSDPVVQAAYRRQWQS